LTTNKHEPTRTFSVTASAYQAPLVLFVFVRGSKSLDSRLRGNGRGKGSPSPAWEKKRIGLSPIRSSYSSM
jgi:hypothetical protein